MLLYWFGIQMISSFTGAEDGVAYLAHIGGFAFGALFAVFYRNKTSYKNSENMIG
jgi:membrane associated rhomboid family serine protease